MRLAEISPAEASEISEILGSNAVHFYSLGNHWSNVF
jgi:hypothetical protein